MHIVNANHFVAENRQAGNGSGLKLNGMDAACKALVHVKLPVKNPCMCSFDDGRRKNGGPLQISACLSIPSLSDPHLPTDPVTTSTHHTESCQAGSTTEHKRKKEEEDEHQARTATLTLKPVSLRPRHCLIPGQPESADI